MMVQYQHQHGGAATGGGRGGLGGGLKTTGLDDDGAGTGARGAGGGGGFTVAMTPRGRGGGGGGGHADAVANANGGGTCHVIPILSPEQKVAIEEAEAAKERYRMERAVAEAKAVKDRKERAVAEAEAVKDRKVNTENQLQITNTLGALAVTVRDIGNTVGQHTGQIRDLKGGQKALQEDNRQVRGQLTQQGEELDQLGEEVGELQETAEEHRRRLESIEQHSELFIQIFMRVAECAIGMGLLPHDLNSSALALYSKLESSGLDSHQDYLFTSVQWNSDSSLVSKGIGNSPKWRWELKSFVVMTTENFGEQQEGPFRGSTHVVVKRPVHAFKLPFPAEEAPLQCQYIYPPLQRFTQINILEYKDEDVDHWLLGTFRVDGEKTFLLVEENFSFHGFGGEEYG